MAGFTKLYQTILTSTVWGQDATTRCVWVAMLAMADQHGVVSATVPGLARFANVSLEECEAALQVFLAPDKYSRTKKFEGRRVEAVDGGWLVLNHAKYREHQTEQQIATAERVKAHRARQRTGVTRNECNVTGDEVTRGNAEFQPEAESRYREQIQNSEEPPSGVSHTTRARASRERASPPESQFARQLRELTQLVCAEDGPRCQGKPWPLGTVQSPSVLAKLEVRLGTLPGGPTELVEALRVIARAIEGGCTGWPLRKANRAVWGSLDYLLGGPWDEVLETARAWDTGIAGQDWSTPHAGF